MKNVKKRRLTIGLWFCLLLSGWHSPCYAREYTLRDAVTTAQTDDPWLRGSYLKESRLRALGESAGALPDPTMNIGIANLPIDSADIHQEPMTQFRVGFNQVFPRGKTRSLRQEKLEKLSGIQAYARAERRAWVAVTVSHLWLDAYRSQRTIDLVEEGRDLFEHLVDVAQSSYATASGRTRQQDLVRAQLELTRLEDRLSQLRQHGDVYLARLGEWLPASKLDPVITIATASLPEIDIHRYRQTHGTTFGVPGQEIDIILSQHPKVKAIDKKISAMHSGVRLAKQSYKPQWGVNASYGYRSRDMTGRDQADFFSLELSFDVPLFTHKKQDKQVHAATSETEAVKTERALLLRRLRARFAATQSRYDRLLERKTLFEERLLTETHSQAEAALSAYTSDDGDFAEVVRARIAELNVIIDALNINVDIQKEKAQIHYFFSGDVGSLPAKSGTNNE